jgi:hypothetical protein
MAPPPHHQTNQQRHERHERQGNHQTTIGKRRLVRRGRGDGCRWAVLAQYLRDALRTRHEPCPPGLLPEVWQHGGPDNLTHFAIWQYALNAVTGLDLNPAVLHRQEDHDTVIRAPLAHPPAIEKSGHIHGFLIKILPASGTPQTCWGSPRSLRVLPEN